MSLDLYQDETRERMSALRPVATPEAGVFENFAAGSAKVAMRGFAEFGSGIDIAGGALAVVQDKIMGTGTEAQDLYFKEHDDVFGSAVDYWTPKPNEVGVASEVVGSLLSTLPLVILSPGAVVASTQLHTAERLVQKGVGAGQAQAVGAVQGVGLGLGVWMPILGQNGWQRVLIGGAGFNVAQGVLMRGASAEILEGSPAAEEFKAFDGKAMTLDVLLGAAFGSLAHLSPSQRQQGAQYWERLTNWAQKLDPSQVDAISALRQSQHMNVDSVPGKLEGTADIEAHTQRVKAAIDQLSKGEPVAVDDLRAPAFEPDAKRTAAAEKTVESLDKVAEDIRTEEGIAPIPAKVALRIGGKVFEAHPGEVTHGQILNRLAREYPEVIAPEGKPTNAIEDGWARGERFLTREQAMQELGYDDTQSTAGIRAAKETEGPAATRGAEPPPPRGAGEAAGPEANESPYLAEATRIAEEHPGLKVRTGMDATGEPVTQTAKAFVEQAKGGATKIREQAKLLAIAAQCLLGVL